MCFSAGASFTAGAVCGSIGILTAWKAGKLDRRYLAIGIIPIVFAVHQFLEGMVWLTDGAGWGAKSGLVYEAIANCFWPAYVPFSAWLAERDVMRRRLILPLLLVGLSISIYGVYVLTFPIAIYIVRHHVVYAPGTFPPQAVLYAYAVVVCLPFMLMKDRKIALFGLLLFLEFPLAMAVFIVAQASIWCFFAAISSTVLLWGLSSARKEKELVN